MHKRNCTEINCDGCYGVEQQDEIAALKAELEATGKALDGEAKAGDEARAEVAKLREALRAAQAVFNQFQCYSTGVSVMAEEDVVELFAKYSDLMDGLIV